MSFVRECTVELFDISNEIPSFPIEKNYPGVPKFVKHSFLINISCLTDLFEKDQYIKVLFVMKKILKLATIGRNCCFQEAKF